MPIRNPFKKTPGGLSAADTNARGDSGQFTSSNASDPGFQAADIDTLKSASAISIKPKGEEPNEFQMSVVNDSGVYLPPSPPEKKSFWHRSNNSTTSSNHRNCLKEDEPFSISRESFDSYRRSFDISARSPVILPETPPRQSLDMRSARTPRSMRSDQRSGYASSTQEEEDFEEVGLADETKQHKKRGLFSRFGDSENSNASGGHLGFHNLTGRKRGHSGQGAELGKMERPSSSGGHTALPSTTAER